MKNSFNSRNKISVIEIQKRKKAIHDIQRMINFWKYWKKFYSAPLFNGIWIVRDFSWPTLKRQSLGAQLLDQSQVVQILFLQSSFRVRVCLLNPRETFVQMIPLHDNGTGLKLLWETKCLLQKEICWVLHCGTTDL